MMIYLDETVMEVQSQKPRSQSGILSQSLIHCVPHYLIHERAAHHVVIHT